MSVSLSHYPALFSELTPDELHVLYYCAFSGQPVGDKYTKKYCSVASCTESDAKKTIDRLKSLGLLIQRNFTSSNRSARYIAPTWVVFTLCHLLQFDQPWLKKLQKVVREYSYLSVVAERMLEVIAKLSEGKKLSIDFYYPWGATEEYARVLAPVLVDPLFHPVLKQLPLHAEREILNIYREWDRAETAIDLIDYACRINLNDKQPSLLVTRLMEEGQMMHFFRHGDICHDKNALKLTPEHVLLEVEALRSAYRGDLQQAITLMEKAIKLNNKEVESTHKGILNNNIANFLLFVLYAKAATPQTIKKLDQACRKKGVTEDYRFRSSQLLAEYFRNENRQIDTLTLAYALKEEKAKTPSTIEQQMCFLFAKYAQVRKESFTRSYVSPSLNVEDYIPSLPILKHEMAHFLPISEEEKAALQETFGGEPLLNSIRRKSKWELVLESMLAATEQGKKQSGTDNGAKTRLVYVFDTIEPDYYEDFVELEVRLQNRLKNGEWGQGKKLSYSAYDKGNFDMDEKDRIIWQNNQSNYDMPSLEAVIPHLVGEDRLLFAFTSFDRQPVKVVEVKPFLVEKRSKDSISIESNIPDYVDLDSHVVFDFDEHNLVINYYPLTQPQRELFRQFLSLGRMPLEAEPLLKRVFPNLSSMVEIHSDYIDGATKLREVDGQTKVCLRIVPVGNFFNLNVSILPLEGGKQSLTPGAGSRIVYDEVDGERCQVKRHLRQESDNGALFMDFLTDLGADTDEWTAQLMPDELLELLDFAHDHPEEGYIEWPEGERMKLKAAEPSTWNISIKKNGGWFDLEGEIPIDDETVLSVGQLMEMMQGTRSRFVKVGEEQYISLSESLRKQLMRLESLSSNQRSKTRIPAVGMALMGDALKGDLEIKHSKETRELTERIRRSAKLQPEVPEALNATLRDYQVDGFSWMCRLDSWGAGACLADDMGLGKTIQTIAFLLARSADGAALVVAPASVVPNWKKEVARFAPSLRCTILNEADDRNALISEVGPGDVVLSTYGLLVTQEEALTQKEWATICLDEAHTIKNRDTKTSGVCMKLQSQHRIILTGTPIQNHLGELWNLFQFVNPGLLGSYDNFNKKFIIPIEGNGDNDRRQQLKRIISPFMLRRTKSEVVAELPDKQDITINVELSKQELGIYEVLRRKAQKELEQIQLQGSSLNVNALAEITRLRMCSCSASLVEKSWPGTSAKIESFLDLAQELTEGGNRALVFSQFTSFLTMVKDALQASPNHKHIKCLYLDGSTTMKQRTKMVEAFQRGEADLFFISLKAGGLGLNLTGANYVIHLDPWWNPAIEQQATDRAHRIGQQQKVTVYHLIAQHTIEEKILRLHETKRNLAESLLEGSNQSHKITVDQLLSLIN